MIKNESNNVSLKDKFLLTFTEASKYFGIGEGKLRNMANIEDNPSWILYNGQRALVKRVQLETILLESETI